MTKHTIIKVRKAPKAYKLDPEKLKGAPQSILPYILGCFYFTEDFEYFDVIKPYLDIPEKPKTLEEISQELKQKGDEIIETFKQKSINSQHYIEYRYNALFNRIIENFEYAVKNGSFPLRLTLGKLDFSDFSKLSVPSYVENSFVIKQGNKHEGYYTNGNRRYLKHYMPDKPNRLVRFFMKTCLGLFWVDEKDG